MNKKNYDYHKAKDCVENVGMLLDSNTEYFRHDGNLVVYCSDERWDLLERYLKWA